MAIPNNIIEFHYPAQGEPLEADHISKAIHVTDRDGVPKFSLEQRNILWQSYKELNWILDELKVDHNSELAQRAYQSIVNECGSHDQKELTPLDSFALFHSAFNKLYSPQHPVEKDKKQPLIDPRVGLNPEFLGKKLFSSKVEIGTFWQIGEGQIKQKDKRALRSGYPRYTFITHKLANGTTVEVYFKRIAAHAPITLVKDKKEYPTNKFLSFEDITILGTKK